MRTNSGQVSTLSMCAASFILLLGVGACADSPDAAPESGAADTASPALVPLHTQILSESAAGSIPRFEVDAAWPELPSDWIIGQVSGVSVDANDNVWIVHRPGSLDATELGLEQDPPLAACCRAAPPVIQFSPTGEVLAAWGGPEHAPDIDGVNQWPSSMHGIYIDEAQTVWIAGNGGGDHTVQRYTMDGEYMSQFGLREQTGGNLDTETLGRPADLVHDVETGEVLVADGYQNNRIFGFDVESGEFTRYWGAFGDEPASPAPDQARTPEAAQFATPTHCIYKTSENLIYVCDRVNNRLQLFRDNGGDIEFVETIAFAPSTGFTGTATDVVMSPDGTYLYVADMANGQVWVVLAETHEPLAVFGRNGRYAGEFTWLHSIAVDSEGNLYTTEVNNGRRVQKLVRVGSL